MLVESDKPVSQELGEFSCLENKPFCVVYSTFLFIHLLVFLCLFTCLLAYLLDFLRPSLFTTIFLTFF